VARRACLLALLTAIALAVLAPWTVRTADGCDTGHSACVSSSDHDAVPCVTDQRCAGAVVGAGALALLAVAAASPALPAPVARRHRPARAAATPPRLGGDRLLRPPQAPLPS
jgi:hypothetical protein